MSGISDRISKLSPEKLELLRRKLEKEGKKPLLRERIGRRINQNDYPLSFSQQRLWFLHQLQPESPFYNIPSAIRLRGKIDSQRLEKSISEIIKRHEILRAYFTADEHGEPKQSISANCSLPLEMVDLSINNLSQAEKEAAELLKKEASRPFNLAEYPLLRTKLFRLHKQDHILFVNMHHIITDGWSLGIFIRELLGIYQALQKDRIVTLAEPTLQFADYTQWQIERAAGSNLDQQLKYWQDYLQGMPDNLDLLTDKPRPAIQTFKGKHFHFVIDSTLSTKLRALSRELKVSLFTLLMSAFQLFLHKISGQEDFGIGAPIANRNRAEIEDVIGFFVNTIVLRSNFKQDIPFNELVLKVNQEIAAASDNQDVPFEKIVQTVQTGHELSHSPLFQVMFDLQNLPFGKIVTEDFNIEIAEIEIEVAKFDLLLLLVDDAEKFSATLEYNTDLFETNTIQRWCGYFLRLLENICQKPDANISQLLLVNLEEKQALLRQWNNTRTEYPRDLAVNVLCEQQVLRTPTALALDFPEAKLTFEVLNQRANQFAHYLISLGIKADDLITLYMERNADLFISILGILKAGAVYVPLDTAYPKERLAFMLEDTGSPLLITQEELLKQIPETPIRVICIEREEGVISRHSTENLPPQNNGSSRAYIIYTSGSTGIPKGVVVPHRAISRLVLNTNYIHLTPTDRIAQISNASFDAATLEIWGSFLCGAALVGIPKDTVLLAREFTNTLREKQITTLFITTALFNQIVAEIPEAFKSLKVLMTGGDNADPKSFKKVLHYGAPEHLLNVYGPTENTTYSSWYEVTEVEEGAKTIPIGKPLANSVHYIVDRYLQPVPPGVPGELLLGGDGLASGYHNRPELNSEKFIRNPFVTDPDAHLYRTGDQVYYQEDGQVVFLGRIDQQVKIRGFRVELGEIENRLKSHPAIKDSVVIAREDMPGAKELVAYFVPAGSPPPAAEIRQYLAQHLPDYMIPSSLIDIPVIPVTPNGKVDRKALPVPGQDRKEFQHEYVPPRNKLEQYLADLWQDILGVEKIGIHDNFFDLGGNSLKAAVFANRIQKEFNEVLHVGAIFKAPRISELSMYVSEYFSDWVKNRFGIEAETLTRFKVDLGKDRKTDRIDLEDLKTFRHLIHKLPAFDQPLKDKNQQAVFLLSPPRSGSTLLRIMLAGNPKLFSPPELDLLSFNTLRERKEAFSGNGLEIWLEAPLRALMEIKQCEVEEARRYLEECENNNLSTKQFYHRLQELLDARLIVDKTPTYGFDLNILQRAEDDFKDPLYIHLIRHPYAMIYSFIEAKLDKNFFRYQHHFTRRQLAELIWIVTHQNILEFQKSLPPERIYKIHFENLVTESELELRQLCGFLKIDFHPDMLKPYEGKKMTDGISAHSQMVGDFKFYLHKNINSAVAHKWKNYHSHDFLSDISWSLAEHFGYVVEKDLAKRKSAEKTEKMSGIEQVDRNQNLLLSYAQQRLWFLEQMDPANASYNIPAAIRLKGRLKSDILQEALNQIIVRHEILRTIFLCTEDGKALQSILPTLKIKLTYNDISHLEEDKLESEAQKIANEEARRPFNLATGPLIRARLIRLANEDHVFIIIMHHIISDGWSMNIFIQELALLYNSLCQGKTALLPDLPVQYVDYASWQRGWLGTELMNKQLQYWKNALSGLSPYLDLATDYKRPAIVTYEGSRKVFQIPHNLWDGFRKISNQSETTTFMTFLAAFQALLYRYSRQEDFAVGTPIAGRTRSEIEPLIGFFVNTIVLRSDMSGNPSFSDLLKRAKQTVTEAFDYQDIPFEKLVDSLQPERDMSHTPLFQVMFSHHRSNIQNFELENLSVRPFNMSSGSAKFDLNLEMIEYENRLVGVFEYKNALFKSSTIDRMIDHFLTLIKNIIKNPQQPINHLNLLNDAERQRILTQWNREYLDYPRQKCIHQLFEQQVLNQPQAIAALMNQETISYRELNEKANQLAGFLIRSGLKREGIIGILMERSLEMIIGIMAVLKAGGAYLPLDPTYPEERLRFILEDAQAPFLLTHRSLAAGFSLTSKIIAVDECRKEIAAEAQENLTIPVNGRNLAYVIYTSGSTGQPKGVIIEHSAALNLAANLKKTIYERFADQKLRISLNAPIPFDASVQQIVMLTEGHTLCIIPADVRGEGSQFLEYIRNHHIEVVDCVPSQLKMLISAGLLSDPGWKPKALLPGGEAIDPNTWQQLVNCREIEFYNMYGPTECAVDSTMFPVKLFPERPVIGKPVANAQFYILDENEQAVPIGVPGELCIAGEGLARGYLNRPELTAEKFVANPFLKSDQTRMYKSGDLVRYLEDGHVEFLGRVDHQVKVRGFRMELGEIEANLERHPAIRDAVVVTREIKEGDRRLVAYLVATNKDQQPGIGELRDYLKKYLPDYMIPAVFMFLDSIPLLPNGKVNRQALPEAQFDRKDLETELVSAQNESEEILLKIWQEVLGVNELGIRDNFFELGGDSILTIQVIARAKQKGISVSPRQLFENPTIQRLAAVAQLAPKIKAEQGLISGTVRLTPIQMHFFNQNYVEMQHWNQSLMLEVAEDLNPENLKEVSAAILRHHDALRSRFKKSENGWTQFVVENETAVPFEYFDVSDLLPGEQDKQLLTLTNQLQSSLNLENGPIIRIAYFNRGSQFLNRILIIIHHLAIDGVSWRILTDDLQLGYSQSATGQPIVFHPKTTSFQHWANKLYQLAQGAEVTRELIYWLKQGDHQPLEFPVDFDKGLNNEESAATLSSSLSTEHTRLLLKEAQIAYNTQINEFLLTAFLRAFAKWSGRAKIQLYLEGHGREDIFEDVDLSRTVGWFTSLFPVYLELPPALSEGESIKSVKEQMRAIPGKGLGFGLLKYLSEDKTVPEKMNSFSTASIVFNYLGQFDQNDSALSNFKPVNDIKSNERNPKAKREFLIDISCSVRNQQFQIYLTYSRNVHKESTIQQLANGFIEELQVLIKHCQTVTTGALTPSDFKEAKLSQDDLDDILAELE